MQWVSRLFGFMVAESVFVAVLSFVFFLLGRPQELAYPIICAGVIFIGFMVHAILDRETGGFVQGFRDFGRVLSGLVNLIILVPVYLLGVGIPSVLGKLTGKRFLKTGFGRSQKSYWEEYRLGRQKREKYYRQF